MLQALIARETVVADPSDVRAAGHSTRSRVLGADHVARAHARSSDFDAPFQDLLTDAAWGHVWSRPDIPARERSMLTIALLAALGHWSELAMHVRATRNTGASPADIREALLHVAIYAGIPAANRAFEVAREALAEIEPPAPEGDSQ